MNIYIVSGCFPIRRSDLPNLPPSEAGAASALRDLTPSFKLRPPLLQTWWKFPH